MSQGLQIARQHLQWCQEQLREARSGGGQIHSYEERAVLDALDWVWAEQEERAEVLSWFRGG